MNTNPDRVRFSVRIVTRKCFLFTTFMTKIYLNFKNKKKLLQILFHFFGGVNQMTGGVSDDDDNCENKSVDSMANRKRKLNTILGSNKRMHVELPIKAETDFDSDSNNENNDRATSLNDNDDGASSRMSDFDDGQ